MREEWLEGERVVGITSGASAPEDLVQRLVEFFRPAAPTTSKSWRSSRRTCASCSPRSSARRSRPAPPDAELEAPGHSCSLAPSCLRSPSRYSTSWTCGASRSAGAVARRAAGFDRLVLLGDVLQLRHGPDREALASRVGRSTELGEALAAGGEVVIVAGNHDHHLFAVARAPGGGAAAAARPRDARRLAAEGSHWPTIAAWRRRRGCAPPTRGLAPRGRVRHAWPLLGAAPDDPDVRAPRRRGHGPVRRRGAGGGPAAPRTTSWRWRRSMPGSMRSPSGCGPGTRRPAAAAARPAGWRALTGGAGSAAAGDGVAFPVADRRLSTGPGSGRCAPTSPGPRCPAPACVRDRRRRPGGSG